VQETTAASNRETPVNLDAEESALGSAMLSAEALEIIALALDAKDFSLDQHRIIFRALLNLRAQGKPADPTVLAGELKNRGELEAAGDRAYILLLTDTCPNPYNAQHYAALVKEAANLRRIIKAGQELENAGYSREDALDALSRAQDVVNDRSLESNLGGELLSEGDNLAAFAQEIVSRQIGGDITGLATGFTHLDHVTNGLNQGLMVIGGSPSCGKTTLAFQLANQVAEYNAIPVLYYSLDQAVEDLRIRTLSRLTNIENRDIFRGRLKPGSAGVKHLEDIVSGYKETADLLYLFGPGHNFSIERAGLTARRVMREHKADKCFVVVDYLQKVYPQQKSYSEYERLNVVVSQLSNLAGDLRSPVLAISEVNRASYQKKSLRAFKDSGRIEYGADVAGLLISETAGGPRRKVDLHVVKNRNGERATINFDFWANVSTFKELGQTVYQEEPAED
jgi:replicative DNA helicase